MTTGYRPAEEIAESMTNVNALPIQERLRNTPRPDVALRNSVADRIDALEKALRRIAKRSVDNWAVQDARAALGEGE